MKVVFGPGTFVNEAAGQIDEQLASQSKQAEAQAKQAERAVTQAALKRGLSAAEARTLGRQASKITTARFQEGLVTLALQYGLTSKPSIDNHEFVTALVFDSSKRAGTPKQRFAYLFPSRETALVSVRMRAGLSESQRTRTIGLIRQAVAMPQWRLRHGERYLVTGVPVIVSDLTNSITHSIELLLIAVLLVMAASLGLIFTGRPRLLPLAVAVLAAALTFGALSLAGASLTVASIAVLPVLVGLAVDYAIQFQSRVQEESERDPGEARETVVVRAAALGAPTIATAGAASAAAMLVLLLSPVPMVRGFGLLLVLGVIVAFLCALTAGAGVLALPGRRRAGAEARPAVTLRSSALAALAADVASAWREAGELLRDNPLTRAVTRGALVGAIQRPGRVLLAGLVLAALGWGLDTQTRVETDITKLVPQNLSSLEGLDALEHSTGVGGEIDLMVSSNALTKPATIEWMSRYEKSVLERYGYSSASGCGKARLCPAFSLARPVLHAGRHRRADRSRRRRQSETGQSRQSGAGEIEQAHAGRGDRSARRDPAVLLPGRDHARSAGGDARVRHPADEPATATAADRRDARGPAPAGRCHRAARRPAGARGQVGHRGRLAAAPRGDAAGEPRRGRARAAARLRRRSPPRARPARADRAGERLVGADPVRRARPAEPDVGHARRARDRDLDRVQRAAVRAPPPGAARGVRHGRGAAPQPIAAPGPRSPPPA